jgi:hypothetical protein
MVTFSTRIRRRFAGTMLVAGAVAGVAVAGAGAAPASASATADRQDHSTALASVSRAGSGAAAAADEPLWFIRAKHTGLSIIHSAIQDRMVQRDMTGLNPLFSGQLYYFRYNPASGAYVVESHNGGCLDIKDGISKSVGADLSLNQCDGTISQEWFSPGSNAAGWQLKNRWSGLHATVDGTGNNAPVRQRADTGGLNQRFDEPLFVG